MTQRQHRGKRKDNGEWVYGYLIGSDVIVGNIIEWDSEYFNTEFWTKVDSATVGQRLERKDINDKPIFEGDRLHIEIKHYATGKLIESGESVVEYRYDAYGVLWGYKNEFTPLDRFVYTTFEVVGNKYEEDGHEQ